MSVTQRTSPRIAAIPRRPSQGLWAAAPAGRSAVLGMAAILAIAPCLNVLVSQIRAAEPSIEADDDGDLARKAEIMNSPRWRRASTTG